MNEFVTISQIKIFQCQQRFISRSPLWRVLGKTGRRIDRSKSSIDNGKPSYRMIPLPAISISRNISSTSLSVNCSPKLVMMCLGEWQASSMAPLLGRTLNVRYLNSATLIKPFPFLSKTRKASRNSSSSLCSLALLAIIWRNSLKSISPLPRRRETEENKYEYFGKGIELHLRNRIHWSNILIRLRLDFALRFSSHFPGLLGWWLRPNLCRTEEMLDGILVERPNFDRWFLSRSISLTLNLFVGEVLKLKWNENDRSFLSTFN